MAAIGVLFGVQGDEGRTSRSLRIRFTMCTMVCGGLGSAAVLRIKLITAEFQRQVFEAAHVPLDEMSAPAIIKKIDNITVKFV